LAAPLTVAAGTVPHPSRLLNYPHADGPRRPAPPESERMSDDEKTNILIVDDLPEKVLVYRSVLDDLGQNIVVARSGEEALRLVLRHEFAVILLDVNMPGIDGFETASLIRKRRRSSHTPIIFVTAFADEVRQAEGYAQGAVDYILAPVVPEILRAKVRVFVDLFRMTQQVRRQAEERVALAEERTKRAAAEEANRRLTFLAGAAAALGQSLDVLVTARDVARVSVPFLADAAAIALRDPPGGVGGVTLARADGRGVRVEELPSPDLLPAPLGDAVVWLLSGDVPRPSQPDSVLALPLRARGRTLAVLALAREGSGREFGPVDLATAEALASRAAIALDNARLHREVQHADRQKNEFLSMLAHELRNPLAPIRNAVEVMRLKGQVPPELGWARDVIDRQIRQLTRLVDDLLDVSRITRGKIELRTEPTDLGVVVAHAVEASRPFIELKEHRLAVSAPREAVHVVGDPARLAQVLTNLLNNAAKYTEMGGQIWLTLRVESGEAVVSVRDTGIGIPPEMLAAVFELFTQVEQAIDRAQGGLGVGLTLVKRLVELHGGNVRAISAGPGQGSEFIVRLPMLLTSVAGPANVPIHLRSSEAHPLRVLVVDDNVDAADSLGRLLELEGHEVRRVHDGPTALAAADAFRPDVVVLDLGMPGMDGYEVARRLRDRDEAGVVLVALSGYGRDDDRRRARLAGFDHHLTKPAEIGTLRALLASAASLAQ
jgi:signal transduction histidine kinase/CheY-like chemotaxis protein